MKAKRQKDNRSRKVITFLKELLGGFAWVGVVLFVCLLALFVSSLVSPDFRKAMPFEFWIFAAVVLLYLILWMIGGTVRLIEKRKKEKEDKEKI